MNKRSIGIDVDCVIRDIMPKVLEIYKREFGKDVDVTAMTDYGIEKYMPEIGNASEFFQYHAKEIFRESPMIPDAAKTIDTLIQDNDIFIVTAQRRGDEQHTLDWLHEHDIKYNGIYLGFDKTVMKTDFLIDDKPQNVYSCHGRGLAFAAPWNRMVEPRFHNWNEINEYFKNERYIRK
jgi:5'(3')-deoxyribonucleotidase